MLAYKCMCRRRLFPFRSFTENTVFLKINPIILKVSFPLHLPLDEVRGEYSGSELPWPYFT